MSAIAARLTVPVKWRSEAITYLLVLAVFPLGWLAGSLQSTRVIHQTVNRPAPIRSLAQAATALGKPAGQVAVSGHTCTAFQVSDGYVLTCP